MKPSEKRNHQVRLKNLKRQLVKYETSFKKFTPGTAAWQAMKTKIVECERNIANVEFWLTK